MEINGGFWVVRSGMSEQMIPFSYNLSDMKSIKMHKFI